MKKETKCVQSGYSPKNGEPRVTPISMSTTFKYDSTQLVGDLFDGKASGYFYTRLANPTVAVTEAKMADLEGGIGAMMTASGQSASMTAILNIANNGDHIVSSAEIYGGTLNLYGVTFKKLGIGCDFVNIHDLKAVEKAIKPNTKAIFTETLANPALTIPDIEALAALAHKYGIPLIIDNTFATPVLCRPIEYGADIVIHSTSKYTDGHAVSLGGMVIDSGNFDWSNGKFPDFTNPDDSYHGMVWTRDCGKAAYITKLRFQYMRDMGVMASPMNAFLANLGLETLHLRMERHSFNALKVAEYLSKHPKVKSIKYPGLKSDPDYDRCQKYLGGQASGVVTFELESREACVKFMDSLKLAAIVVHVADVRTGALHPASSTHRQLTDEQLVASGISPATIRFSVGIENITDIIEDIEQALNK